MQLLLDLGAAADLVGMRNRLRRAFPKEGPFRIPDPVAELVNALISSRTRDEVSGAAFMRLTARYPSWDAMMEASVADIEAVLVDVFDFKNKAAHLQRTLRIIAAGYPGFDIGFLGRMPVPDALAWLEKLPGVGPKVAAAVLNFSTLARPCFVVDTHVQRVLRRYGIVRPNCPIGGIRDCVMGALPGWSAEELAELHLLLKRLGQSRCGKLERRCDECPLAESCAKCAD
jgi:endonuclease-3